MKLQSVVKYKGQNVYENKNINLQNVNLSTPKLNLTRTRKPKSHICAQAYIKPK